MSSSLRNFFLDYDPQDDVTSPADYAYLIMLRHILSVISSWPLKILDPLDTGALQRRKIWVTIQRSFHVVVTLITTVCGVTYVVLHKKSMTFFELGHLYISLLINGVVFSRIATLCFSDEYVVVVRDFLEKIHLFFYKDRSEYSMKIHKQVHRISHIFTLYLVCQTIVGMCLFNITPMFNNYFAGNYARSGLKGNATFEHALYFSIPFPVSTNLKWYILDNIFAWIVSYLCSTWVCMLDCLLSAMVFHLWGHFKILLYNINNFPRPSSKTSFMFEGNNAFLICEMYSPNELKAVSIQLSELIEYHRNIINCPPLNWNTTLTYEMYSPNELKAVSIQLSELIDYHRFIINFTDKMSEVFGPMLFAYYAFHQACGCLLLLECSQMTAAALTRYLPLTIIVFQQLIQLSIIFELIGSISDKLKDAVYGLPWESMDTKNRRTVAFFLMNVQEPVHVKALGLADVGVTSMTTILKTSISYFTFLNSM